MLEKTNSRKRIVITKLIWWDGSWFELKILGETRGKNSKLLHSLIPGVAKFITSAIDGPILGEI